MKSRIVSMLAIVALLCCGLADAQIPRKLNYQGFLTSPSGAPVNSLGLQMVFNIYNVQTLGSPLHTETQTVAVSNGIFNVLLGTSSALTLPFDAPYYLGVTTGADAEMSPRQPLAASPYALRAVTAESLVPGGNIVLTDPSTASAGNIMKGSSRFIHNPGFANTFVGVDSGNFTVTGSSNTVTGAFALGNVTSGQSNTASGVFALNGNTSGSYNIALGIGAGGALTTGDFNIAIGNAGVTGESNIIRIGTSQTDTYLTGVVHGNGSGLTGLPAGTIADGSITSAKLASNLALAGTTSGTFSGPLTGNVTGNVSGSASGFTGALGGDVGGLQAAITVFQVGGVTAANVAAGASLANAASPANTAGAIVRRDASGNFNAGTISGNVTGNVSGSAASFTGALAGDVTGTQAATAIAATTVTAKALTGFVSGAGTVSASDSILTAINKLDGNVVAATPLSTRNPLQIALLRWYDANQSGNTSFPVGAAPMGVAFDGANIWVANNGSGNVTKLRASDGACIATCTFSNINANTPYAVAFDGANIWVANRGSNNVTKFRASDGACIGTCSFLVGSAPQGVAFDGANIWVPNSSGGTVTRLRASDGACVGTCTFTVAGGPTGIAFDGANMWVTNIGNNTVTKL